MHPPVKDFPALIRWLADRYHDGVIDKVADTVGISGALADKWAKGRVKMPTFATVDKLCSAYRLDFEWVRKLLRAGIRVALAVVIILSSITTASAATEVQTLRLAKLHSFTSYRKWFIHLIHRLWGPVETRAHFMGQGYTRLVTVERYA